MNKKCSFDPLFFFNFEPYYFFLIFGLDGSEDLEKLEETILGMMEKREGGWACTVCGFIKYRKTHVKDHVESKHIRHIGFVCPHCSRVYTGRHSLRSHAAQCSNN